MARIGVILIAALVLLQPMWGWAAGSTQLRDAPMAGCDMPCCPHMHHVQRHAGSDAPAKSSSGSTMGAGCCQHCDLSFVLAPPVTGGAVSTTSRPLHPRFDRAVAFDSLSSSALFRPPRA